MSTKSKALEIEERYPLVMDFGNHKVKFRKWKNKERKALVQLAKTEKNISVNKLVESIIRPCLEERDTSLTYEEIEYMLIILRSESISDSISLKYNCITEDCGIKEDNINISDMFPIQKANFREIKIDDITIKFNNILNNQYYNGMQSKYDAFDFQIYDMALHIESVNKKQDFDIEELVEWFDELDTDVLDEIINEYNSMKFSFNKSHTIHCKDCNNKNTFYFDDIPDFFPDEWLAKV